MADKPLKRYIFASDFDQTLTFNDSGYVLAELVGIPTAEFERKAKGMAKINLVQQGAELAYLLLHDPEFKAKVRKEHLHEVGQTHSAQRGHQTALPDPRKRHGWILFRFLRSLGCPVEVIHSALEGIVPQDHIFGTEFRYKAFGEIDTIVRATAGYGKVAVLNQLLAEHVTGPDHVIYSGDGSSDIHVMLQLNARDGLTIAVSESPHVSQIAKRTVLSTSAVAVLAPILEDSRGMGARAHSQLFRGQRHADPGVGAGSHRLADGASRHPRGFRTGERGVMHTGRCIVSETLHAAR